MITGFIIGVVATLVSVIIGAALMTVKKNAEGPTTINHHSNVKAD